MLHKAKANYFLGRVGGGREEVICICGGKKHKEMALKYQMSFLSINIGLGVKPD